LISIAYRKLLSKWNSFSFKYLSCKNEPTNSLLLLI